MPRYLLQLLLHVCDRTEGAWRVGPMAGMSAQTREQRALGGSSRAAAQRGCVTPAGRLDDRGAPKCLSRGFTQRQASCDRL